jgi:hypothetical protein
MTQTLVLLLSAVLEVVSPTEETDLVVQGLFISWLAMVLVGLFGVFRKADQPGWACLVPIYAELKLLEISGLKPWWLLLLLVPGIGGLAQLAVFVYLVGRFDKGLGYYLGVVFLTPLFLLILGYGSPVYHPPFQSRRSARAA